LSAQLTECGQATCSFDRLVAASEKPLVNRQAACFSTFDSDWQDWVANALRYSSWIAVTKCRRDGREGSGAPRMRSTLKRAHAKLGRAQWQSFPGRSRKYQEWCGIVGRIEMQVRGALVAKVGARGLSGAVVFRGRSKKFCRISANSTHTTLEMCLFPGRLFTREVLWCR